MLSAQRADSSVVSLSGLPRHFYFFGLMGFQYDLFVCVARGCLRNRRSGGEWAHHSQSWEHVLAYLGSPGPKNTPTPALAPACPFLKLDPSVYILSIPGGSRSLLIIFVFSFSASVLWTICPVAWSLIFGSKPSSAPGGSGPVPGSKALPLASFGVYVEPMTSPGADRLI